ncbi:MFS cation transporter [Spiroplasma endosymbiont of Panorpa germanica]|uniref:MFS cation transporter n=1 Tax=Spiroplasma endosymbiont of Panorpa germanica TaxID=3066314 RepID=UPI0030CC135B
MQNYWDLIFLNPILIVVALVSIFFMLKNEKTDLKRKLIYLEIFLFWFAAALIIKVVTWETSLHLVFENSNLFFTLIVFFGINFVAIIFKPIATLVTGKLKSRRLWYWISNATLFMGAILALLNFAILKEPNFITLYFSLILIGFSLSANTLHYLIVCEQTFYRLNPIGSTITVASMMLFGNFIANYTFALVSIYQVSYQVQTLLCLVIIASVLAFGLSFVYKENSNYVGTFSFQFRSELDSFKYIYVIYLSLATFVIVFISEISGGLFFEEYLKIILVNHSKISTIEIYLRLNQSLYYLPQIFFGYLIYKMVLPQMGYKYHFITNLLCLAIWLSIIGFLKNPIMIILFQFLITMAVAQIFYGLFALAVMWNYRIQNFPVTGIVASSGILATFICEGVIRSLQKNKVWIFNYDSDIQSLVDNPDLKQIQDHYFVAWNIGMSILASLTMVLILIFYFTIDKVLSNYVDVRQANLDMIKLNHSQTLQRAETRIVEKEKTNV